MLVFLQVYQQTVHVMLDSALTLQRLYSPIDWCCLWESQDGTQGEAPISDDLESPQYSLL